MKLGCVRKYIKATLGSHKRGSLENKGRKDNKKNVWVVNLMIIELKDLYFLSASFSFSVFPLIWNIVNFSNFKYL